MSRHRVLLFAFHFPPENAIGGARPYRFFKYLTRLGYDCHVITAAQQDGRFGEQVHHVAEVFESTATRGLDWQLERAVRKLILPGVVGLQWSGSASRFAASLAESTSGPVTLLSSYPPLGVHLAAWRLRRRRRIPWIADFRDPFPEQRCDEAENALQLGAYRMLDRWVINSADLMIANTDSAAAMWQQRYPRVRDRIHMIWNGFDPESRCRPIPLPLRPYKVYSHVGELYTGRRVGPILESVGRLIDAGRIAPDHLKIKLVGPVKGPALPPREFTDRASAAGWLDLAPHSVPKHEAESIAANSDGLLLIQPQSAVQVPGKLYEYIQWGRPILAFVPPSSPIERILRLSGVAYRCVYPDLSPQAMDDAILDYLRLPTDARPPSAEFEDQFNGERQTVRLASLIESLHRRS